MGRLANTDVVALARRYLLDQPEVVAAMGGEGRVDSLNMPPYPRVRLNDPPGDDRGLTHLIAPVLQVEVLGDPGGGGQKPALRALLYDVLEALVRLPEAQATGEFEHLDGEPWVTAVTSTGGGGFVPEPPDQPRYIATVRMHVHP